jgi:hypothetical protein
MADAIAALSEGLALLTAIMTDDGIGTLFAGIMAMRAEKKRILDDMRMALFKSGGMA